MKPKQARRNLTKAAQSKQPQTRKAKVTLEHGRHLRPDLPLKFLMPGLAGFFGFQDSSLLEFVAQFIAENGIVFPDHVPQKRGEDFLCPSAELALAEAIIIARTVMKNPGAESFTFPVPGLASHRPLTREQTMHYLASVWHEHHVVWRGMGHWLPGVTFAHDQRAADQFQFAQVRVVCEAWLVRAGTLEQMDYEGPAHRAAFRHYAAALQTATHEFISGQVQQM